MHLLTIEAVPCGHHTTTAPHSVSAAILRLKSTRRKALSLTDIVSTMVPKGGTMSHQGSPVSLVEKERF